MTDDKDLDLDDLEEGEDVSPLSPPSTNRARNKTVMLSPDITNEVRSRLSQDLKARAQIGARSTGPQAPSAGVLVNGGKVGPVSEQLKAAVDVGALKGGSSVQGAKPVANLTSNQIFYQNDTKVVGFLVSYDEKENGEVFELRTGRLIVTSEAGASGSYLFLVNKTVSPMHAILKIAESGKIQVLDQLSEHGTTVISHTKSETLELSGDKAEVSHGDVVKFGERTFIVCMVPQ